MKIIKIETLNEKIEALGENDYNVVMDHTLANSLRDEAKNKELALKVIENKLKEFPLEEKDAHSKVSTPELKKMYLSESLFESWDDEGIAPKVTSEGKEELIGDVYNALTDIAFEYHKEGIDLTISDFEIAWEWFKSHYGADKEDTKPELIETINGNTSHADEFISTLRSAGFGDGFDQKLKIDTYGNGGTRVEYKDQGGHFIVTITDDKVILQGQDEGEEPFDKEYTEWGEFVKEFNSLYPGVPVGEDIEDSQRYPIEGTKQVDLTLNEASYTRSDDKVMLVKQKRDPLVDVIQMELVDGEWGYVKSPDGTITPSKLPHLDYSVQDVGVSFDNSGRYFIRVWDTSEENLQKVADIAKKFNREYKIDFDKYVKGDKKWYCLIYLNEDTDFDDPYVDPDAEVNYEGIKGRGTKMRGNPNGRHMRDNEGLEDSQRYPIESPIAQNESLMVEDISVNGSLMEDKISIDMIHDFKPAPGKAEETFNRVLEVGKMDTLEFALEDRFPQGVTTEELNKILSEEAQWVYDQLGMKEFIIPTEGEE